MKYFYTRFVHVFLFVLVSSLPANNSGEDEAQEIYFDAKNFVFSKIGMMPYWNSKK